MLLLPISDGKHRTRRLAKAPFGHVAIRLQFALQVRGRDLPGAINVLPEGLGAVLAKRETTKTTSTVEAASSSSTTQSLGGGGGGGAFELQHWGLLLRQKSGKISPSQSAPNTDLI